MFMITSVQNQIIKDFKKLKMRNDVICLDNPKLLQEAIKENYKILGIIKTPSCNFDYDDCILVSENVLKTFKNTITSQGVVGFVEFQKKSLLPPKNNFLVLDHVQDPGNVGTLIRSAVGSGFLDIYLINCAHVTSDKTIRSSMGAIFKCNIYEVDDDFINELKNWNKEIYIADMNGDNVFDIQKFDSGGLVIGNEGHGVGENIKKLATKILSLPMKNNLESLNAGVSGSILMYQMAYGGKNVRS